jgi:hypothetical protein
MNLFSRGWCRERQALKQSIVVEGLEEKKKKKKKPNLLKGFGNQRIWKQSTRGQNKQVQNLSEINF